MKKLLLSLMLILVLALSACSMTGFAPWQNSDSNSTTIDLNDTFEFVDVSSNETNVSSNETDDIIISDVEDETDSLILTTVSAVEGDLVSLADLFAVDPDGDEVEYEYSDPFNARGLWQTNDGDEGKYLVEITATDGLLSTTEQILVVVTPSNKAPVVDCPESVAVFEGELIDLPCTIYDREGDQVSYSVTGFMSDLTYQTTYDDEGEYVVIVSATDGAKTTVKEVSVLIANTNRLPVVEEVDPISVLEGEDVVIELEVTDEDGDNIFFSYPSRFTDDGIWSTARGDAGTYEFEVVVSDGYDDVIVPVEVEVQKVNVAPILNSIDPIVVNEGDVIELPIRALDEDGDEVTIEISGFMTTDTYQTTYEDAGEYTVTVSASDEKHTVSIDVEITINDVNRPPVFIVK